MKLKFIIDKKYDFKMILNLLEVDDQAVSTARTKNIGLAFIFSQKNNFLSSKKRREIIKKIVKEKYKRISQYLNKTRVLYQKSWDEINDDFFKTVQRITGYGWKHKTYFCILSPFHKGISSWGGNKIIRSWRENPYTMRKITAHELLISHIFTIFKRDFKKKNLSDKQKWAIAEISAFAIAGLEKQMLKFWPWVSGEEKYPLKHNYPELYNLQKVLKPKYEKRKNFKGFLEEGIKIIKKFLRNKFLYG